MGIRITIKDVVPVQAGMTARDSGNAVGLPVTTVAHYVKLLKAGLTPY